MKYLISVLCLFLSITSFSQESEYISESSRSNNVMYFSILRQSELSIHYERIFRINDHFTVNPHVGSGYITGSAEKDVPGAVNLYHGLYGLAGIGKFYVEAGADYVVQDFGGVFYSSINGNFGLRYHPIVKEAVMLSLTYNPMFYTSNPHNDFNAPYGFSIGIGF